MMKVSDMMKLVNFALADITSSEQQIGNGRQEDNALVFAAIAQAKLLAVIAAAMVDGLRRADIEEERAEIAAEKNSR
jgi:hypothetical protein